MTSQDEDLERLRKILLEKENTTVKQLEKRVTNRLLRTNDVSEVLADASRLAIQRDTKKFSAALEQPVNAAIQTSIQSNPKQFAEFIYPVMMPAIRKSINESLRQFLERIDTAINQRFSLDALRWRLESWRTGVPLADILMRHAILYKVEQVLLIQNESGLLMQHVHTPEIAQEADSDAVSGMLWAIESFVRDSFSSEDNEGLNRVEMGEHVVYMAHTPIATLACVVRGVAPTEYTGRISQILEQIHAQNTESIVNFSGEKEDLEPARALMHDCLEVKYREKENMDLGKRLKFIGAMILLSLILITSWLTYHHVKKNRIESLINTLNATPGIVIHNSKKQNGQWLLQGLIDPLANKPEPLVSQHNLNTQDVKFALTPYLSMEDELLLRRAKADLQAPETVDAQLISNNLFLSGTAPIPWYMKTKQRPYLPQGVSELDLSDIVFDPMDAATFISDRISTPKSVELKPGKNNTLIASGIAPMTWIEQLKAEASRLDNKVSLDYSNLKTQEAHRMEELVTILNSKTIQFDNNAQISTASELVLKDVAKNITELLGLAKSQSRSLTMTIIGRSDILSGKNKEIRLLRAQEVHDQLLLLNIPAEIMQVTEAELTPEILNELGKAARRAEIRVELQ